MTTALREARLRADAAYPPQPSDRPSLWLTVPACMLLGFSAISIVGTTFSMLLMLIGLAVARPRWPFTGRELWRMLLPFYGLFAAIVLSAVFNAHPLANLHNAAHEYRLILLPLFLGLVLPHVDNRLLLRVWCWSVLAMGIYGLAQFLTGWVVPWPARPPLTEISPYYRASGAFINALTYSGYMVLAWPPLLMLGLAERGRSRWPWLTAAAAGVVGILASLSRSSYLGLLASALVLLYRWNRRWATVIVALVLVLMAGMITLQSKLAPDLRSASAVEGSSLMRRFVLSDPADDTSAKDRLFLWQAGLLGFADRPLLGFGLFNHDPELGPYQRRVAAAHGVPDYHYSVGYGSPLHNIYVRSLFDLGLVGFLTYLSLWGAVFATIARGLRRLNPGDRWRSFLLWGLAAAMAGSMVAGFFEDNFYDGEVQAIIVIVMVLALHFARSAAPASAPASDST